MYSYIIDQTINAKLSRSDESIVLRLLHVADPKTGKVALLMDDFLHLCDLKTKGAATRYLCTLKQAGLISYHTNIYRMDAQVFVTFLGWDIEVEEEIKIEIEDQVEGLRAEVREIRRLLVENCALKSARGDGENGETGAQILTEPRADSVQQTDKQREDVSLFVNIHSSEIQEQTNKQTRTTRAKGRADLNVDVQELGTRINTDFIDGFEEISTQISQMDADLDEANISDFAEVTESSGKGSNNFSRPELRPDPFLEDGASTVPLFTPSLTEEQTLSFNLLTDPEIGMGAWKAKQIVQSHRFAYLRRHTFAWLAEMESGDVRGVGALVHRIDHQFGAAEPTAEQQRSALYQRHRTGLEVEAEVKAKKEFAARKAARAQPQTQSMPQPQATDPALWPQVLAQLQSIFPSATYEHFLKPAQLLGIQDDIYRIGLPNTFVRDGTDRYKGTIRRTLGEVVGDEGVRIRLEVAGIATPI